MIILWILYVGSVIVLPGVALLALRWALRHGEFNDLQRAALSIFDDDEPLGRLTDRFTDRTVQPPEAALPRATTIPEHSDAHPGRAQDSTLR
jgi:cbb3-type cytochrome oxidase maturation protein